MKKSVITIKSIVEKVKDAELSLGELNNAMDEVEEYPNAYNLLREQHDRIKQDLEHLLNAEVEFVRTPIKVDKNED